MSLEDEDDSYWNVSQRKGFSFEDDSYEPSLSRLSLGPTGKAGPEDDTVTFEPVGGGQSSAGVREAWQDRVREASRQIAAAAHQPEPSLSQVVGAREPARLEAELAAVRRSLAKLQENRFLPAPPQQTVQDIALGRPYNLYTYTTLKDKTDLLDAALDLGDGAAVLAVTLMLYKTLKWGRFLAVMETRPVAADQLVAHMVTRHELGQLGDLLTALGRRQEAGVVAYSQATASPSLETRVRRLKEVLGTKLADHADADHVIDQINLLERLAPVIANDPSCAGLSSSSVLRTLLHFSTHHWGAGDNLLVSPAAVRRTHQLTDKQWTWVALRARASVEAWSDCEAVVVGRGWLGGKKVRGSVSAAEVVAALHRAGAPADTLQTFLQLVEGVEERVGLARKVGVAAVVVDVLVAQRDRQGLGQFQASLPPNSRDWFYADNALRVSSTKWKN